MLAVYFRWVRQRYFLAHPLKGARPLSVRAVETASIQTHTPYVPAAAGAQVPTTMSTTDFFGIGTSFDGEATDVGYPRELDF